MTMTDNLTRFLGSAIVVLGVSTFILLGAAHSPLKGFPPVLFVPLGFIVAGAYIANKAKP